MSPAATGVGVVRRIEVMGTVVSFDVRTPAPPGEVHAAIDAAASWLRWVDETFSTYKPSSEVNRFDRGQLPLEECCADLRLILALCHRLNQGTGGFFDAWAGGRFDPSGVVKGWSIDRASDLLAASGLTDHAIDGGGDIRLRGTPSPGTATWQVGVRHPLRKDAYCAALSVPEGAVATSGTYERGLHVINPVTGQPANELAAVTIIGPDLTTADAYATAAMAMGQAAPAWLQTLKGYEAQVITPDGAGWSTEGYY